MGIGIYFVLNTSVVLERVQFIDVSLPLAIALIMMMWPILCRVSPSALLRLFSVLFSLVVNWIVAPLLMLTLEWAFLPDREELRTGLILVGFARCIAMVLVWTDISHGDADFCAAPSSSRSTRSSKSSSTPPSPSSTSTSLPPGPWNLLPPTLTFPMHSTMDRKVSVPRLDKQLLQRGARSRFSKWMESPMW